MAASATKTVPFACQRCLQPLALDASFRGMQPQFLDLPTKSTSSAAVQPRLLHRLHHRPSPSAPLQ
jgi:hypothetical protein